MYTGALTALDTPTPSVSFTAPCLLLQPVTELVVEPPLLKQALVSSSPDVTVLIIVSATEMLL